MFGLISVMMRQGRISLDAWHHHSPDIRVARRIRPQPIPTSLCASIAICRSDFNSLTVGIPCINLVVECTQGISTLIRPTCAMLLCPPWAAANAGHHPWALQRRCTLHRIERICGSAPPRTTTSFDETSKIVGHRLTGPFDRMLTYRHSRRITISICTVSA